MQEYDFPARVQKPLLAEGEGADRDRRSHFDAHAYKGLFVRHGENDQSPVVFEGDEPAIEQVIDGGREEKSVLTVESFFV